MKLPRFSLRTLLIAIAILILPLAWIGYQLNWIRQRHAFLNHPPMPAYSTFQQTAPWQLRLFGERGFFDLSVTESTLNRARELFPEAILSINDPQAPGRVRNFEPKR